jgi:hypothetical protein
LNWLPVVVSKDDHHLQGYVRAEKVSHWLLQELGEQTLTGAQGAALRHEEKVQRRTAGLA